MGSSKRAERRHIRVCFASAGIGPQRGVAKGLSTQTGDDNVAVVILQKAVQANTMVSWTFLARAASKLAGGSQRLQRKLRYLPGKCSEQERRSQSPACLSHR